MIGTAFYTEHLHQCSSLQPKTSSNVTVQKGFRLKRKA
jgi:hypothetical protein